MSGEEDCHADRGEPPRINWGAPNLDGGGDRQRRAQVPMARSACSRRRATWPRQGTRGGKAAGRRSRSGARAVASQVQHPGG
eukprot:5207438-Pyramimonas_sp.AAC.1